MIYPENFSPNILKIEYSIEALYLYNPTLIPKKKKAYEEDIQDAKLLYYYPKDRRIEEKRNNVGLAEGMITFWGIFSNNENKTKTQVIYLDQYVHIITNFETDYWLCIVLKSHTKELTYYQNNNSTNTYINVECFKFEKPNLSYVLCDKFVKHLTMYIELFYGSIAAYMIDDRLTEKFDAMFTSFIQNYQKINSYGNFMLNPELKINMLRFYDNYVNYAPIEKKSFLALHYLLNILNSINKNIQHFTVFYYGYFIYSTLEHKIAQLFSDYLYSNADSFQIDPNKIFTKFNHIDDPEKFDSSFTYGMLLNIDKNKGYLTGITENILEKKLSTNKNFDSRNSIAMPNSGIKRLDSLSPEESKSDSSQFKNLGQPDEGGDDPTNSKSGSFFPIIWIKGSDGILKPYKLCTYYDSGLLIMMYFDVDNDINPSSLNEMKYAVSKNIKKCANNLDRNIESIYAQEDSNKLYYLNKANLAMRVNKSFLKFIDLESSRVICDIKNTLAEKEKSTVIINKSGDSWIYAKKFSTRKIFLLLDGELSLSKLEDEKRKIVAIDLPTILI